MELWLLISFVVLVVFILAVAVTVIAVFFRITTAHLESLLEYTKKMSGGLTLAQTTNAWNKGLGQGEHAAKDRMALSEFTSAAATKAGDEAGHARGMQEGEDEGYKQGRKDERTRWVESTPDPGPDFEQTIHRHRGEGDRR